jgi:hypothetical protein
MKKALVLLVTVAACTDSGVALKDLPSKLAAAECKSAVTCQQFPDQATCLASLQLQDTFFLTISAAVTSKQVKYDENLAGDCVSEAAATTCSFTGFQTNPNDPCAKMFTGLVAAGGACFISEECAGGGTCQPTDSTCDPSTTCCPGTCKAAPTPAAIGAACQSTSDCVTGAYCAQTTMKCTALVTASGGACDGIDGCVNPMICNYDFTTNKFTTCLTPAARNATCDPTTILGCIDERDYCDAGTKVCTPDVTTGTACGGASGALCVGYDQCDQTSMKCVALATSGQACTVDSNGFSNCIGSLQCTNATCQLPTAMTCK